jgi:mono/diheme cytochrome c family protein
VARWSASRWIVPAALVLPLALAWYLSAAAHAGAAVAETLGARAAGLLGLFSAVFASANVGQPVVRAAARVAVAGALLLVFGALLLAATRARRYHPIEAGTLMLLGLAAMGGSEWVREGLRKPWVIDRYMLVNSIRVPAPPGSPGAGADPFALDALARRGVLASSQWIAPPAGWRPGEKTFEDLAAAERAGLDAAAGREVFELSCTACHTERGHLAIAPLVRGRSVAAIETVLDTLAKPVSAAGRPVGWSDPSVRLATWLGRRMPPFVGTSAERRALAIHLARLGGDPQAGVEPETRPGEGREVFETYCSPCHGPDAQWPITERLRGRGAAELYDLIGRLPQVREEMPPFAGTEEERRALAQYLSSLRPQAAPAGDDDPAGGEEVRP